MMFGYGKNFFFALFVLLGTIVGAGIFGIPYVISKSGIVPGLFYFLILGGMMLLLHLCYGEIFLRTKEECRFPGLAQKYLGRKSKILVTFSIIIGLIGALLAYIIIGGKFLSILLSPWVDLDPFYLSFFFGLALAPFTFKGIKLVAPMEILTNSAFFLIVLVIVIFGIPEISLENFVLVDISNAFLPYGVLMFSLVGFSAVPEAISVLKTPEEKRSFKRIVPFAFIIVILLYLIFSFAVVGMSGQKTSPDVFDGLISFLGPEIIIFGALAAVITLADSFIVITLYLRNTLVYDYKAPKFSAALFVSIMPLVLFLAGVREFIEVIGFLGAVIGVVEGIIIILIFKKAKVLGDRQPEYSLEIPSFLLYFIMLIFIFGAISQIFLR